MGAEWPEKKLGDLFKVKHGFAFRGEHFADFETPHLLTTPGNFSIGGGFQNDKPKFYSGPVPEDYILNAGDVIVTMTDLSKASDTLGNAAIVPEDENIWLHNQRVGLLEFKDPSETCPQFFSYLLCSHEYRSWIVGSATGTTVKHTSPSRIAEFSCPIPPLPEQKAIAHILGSLDDKIELNRRMNETLEGMVQALFKSWFVNFDPVIDNALEAGNPIPDEFADRAETRRQAITGRGEAPAPPSSASASDAAGATSLPEQIRNLFPDSFIETEEMGWIPEGWKLQPLYDMAKFINGAAYKENDFSESPDALPVIKIAEIKGGITAQTKFTEVNKGEKYKIEDGEILLSWSGNPDTSIDTFIWSNGAGYLNQHIFKVSLYDEADRYFVYYQLKFLRSVFAEIARDKQTTGLGHFTAGDMKRLMVFKPENELLTLFNKAVESLYQRSYGNCIATKTLTKLRDTLLPKLLSGELRVPQAEQMIKDAL